MCNLSRAIFPGPGAKVFIPTKETKKAEGRKRKKSVEYFLLGFGPSQNWIFGGWHLPPYHNIQRFFPPQFHPPHNTVSFLVTLSWNPLLSWLPHGYALLVSWCLIFSIALSLWSSWTRLASFFYKGPDGKYLRFCKPFGLCLSCSTLLS